MEETLVELDDRRRLSLGKIGRHSRYVVHEEPDGTLVLEPAVVLTEMEARFIANKDLWSQIVDNRAHPERRRSRPRRASA